jgi:hypothetical protein
MGLAHKVGAPRFGPVGAVYEGVNESEDVLNYAIIPSFEEGSLRPQENITVPQTGRSGGGQTIAKIGV